MNIVAVSGSPRKNWNTEMLLEHAINGASEAAAKGTVKSRTTLLRLYPMKYTGCISCFTCKKRDSPSFTCSVRDDLSPILEQALAADVLLVGTPVYFSGESAGTRAFMERLLYPLISFAALGLESKREAPLATGLIYNMAVTEDGFKESGFTRFADPAEFFYTLHFKHCERLFVFNTLHTHNYGTLQMDSYDSEAKAEARERQFPEDCAKAFALGARLVQNVLEKGRA